MYKLLLLVALATLSVPSSANGIKGRDHGVSIPTEIFISHIPVCYDFGCNTRVDVRLSVPEWKEVIGWFRPAAATPADEREQLRKAIGWMEVLVGRHTPTSIDLEFDKVHNINKREPGQLDCIDESVNTSVYLHLFESSGLLKHHVVIEEAYRKAILDQHWAGQVKEIKTGTRYIFDSWFQPNGYLPVVQKSLDWENISMLSAVVDNSVELEEQYKAPLWRRILRLD